MQPKRLYLGTPEGDMMFRLRFPGFVKNYEKKRSDWEENYKFFIADGKVKFEYLKDEPYEAKGTVEYVSEFWLRP